MTAVLTRQEVVGQSPGAHLGNEEEGQEGRLLKPSRFIPTGRGLRASPMLL